jgi:thiol-disulfide isomerase/thioredoxin
VRVAGLAVVLLMTLLVGCSSDASDSSEGGSPVGLPGPVPDGVTFRPPPKSAPPAPSFELQLLDGQVVDSDEQWAERPVVLVFFESWCELCRQQQPEINELVEDYRDVVLFLGIAGLSEPGDLRAYIADNDVEYPVATDPSGDVWLRYAVDEAPLVALVSKGGSLLRGWPGGLSGDELRGQIDELAVG